MMEKRGNLLAVEEGIIAHQVNCKGVMRTGITSQIKGQLLTIKQYCHYRRRCAIYGDNLLGTCYIDTVGDKKYVAHLFAENVPTGNDFDTDYDALERSIAELALIAVQHHMPVAVPGYLGCGLSGGNWERVYTKILKKHFNSYPYGFTIIYNMDSIYRLWLDFGDIPMNPETECIENEWHGFEAGTHREDIWKWFEETFNISVAIDLMAIA